MPAIRAPRSAAVRSAERGSAYLFVLLGLLVLTIIGLSLVVVTQTEVQIGGAEKSAARILYGADSGLHSQLGLHFLELDPGASQFTLATTDADDTIVATEEVVDVSPFYPIYSGPCALCSVNVGSEQRYYLNNYGVNAQGKRFGAGGCNDTPQGVELLSEMFLIQPESQPGGGVDVSIRTFDKEETLVDFIGTATCVEGLTTIRY